MPVNYHFQMEVVIPKEVAEGIDVWLKFCPCWSSFLLIILVLSPVIWSNGSQELTDDHVVVLILELVKDRHKLFVLDYLSIVLAVAGKEDLDVQPAEGPCKLVGTQRQSLGRTFEDHCNKPLLRPSYVFKESYHKKTLEVKLNLSLSKCER